MNSNAQPQTFITNINKQFLIKKKWCIINLEEIKKGVLNMAKERFVETYSQGVANIRKIIVDAETGVNYLLLSSNMTSGCGVTVLVDQDGKPIVTPVSSTNQ